jgi:hypothetical protein
MLKNEHPEAQQRMLDPHVDWLEYEMEAAWIFDDPPPLRWQDSNFDIVLDDSVVRAEMRLHFATEREARAVVEPFLQSWEIDVALSYGQRQMTFKFKRAHVVDRNPVPPGSVITGTARIASGRASVSATGEVRRKTYPTVPTSFVAVPDVITMWNRFEGYKAGREPIVPMAYFCLTVIEYRYNSRKEASNKLSVEPAVLGKLGALSTNRGDMTSARKLTKELVPLTANELQWLEAAIPALIRRLGEIAAGQTPSQLTMAQLPKL